MPRFTMRQFLQWPEKHGFSIGGLGPSYVLKVAKGSAADKQGLKVGDQIIELDGHKVAKMAAPALESFAKHLNNKMPTIKVVNEVQYVELIATRLHRLGLTLQYTQRNGFIIDSLHHRGPAYRAGLREGDLVIEVNGELIYDKGNSLSIIQKVIEAHRGRTTLAVLPCNSKHRQRPAHTKSSRELYAKVNRMFAQNYEKKLALVGVLKSYAESGNIEKLAKSIVLILQTPNQRKVIPYIRLHVPIRDRKLFDDIIQRSIGKTYSEDRLSQPVHESLSELHFQSAPSTSMNIQPSVASHSSLLYLRSVTILKGDGDLGVVMKGRHPVVIEAVLPNSAADRAGVLKGDCILKIDQQSVVNSSHYDIQKLLKRTGPTVYLEVMQQVHMSNSPNSIHLTNGSSPYNYSPPMISPWSYEFTEATTSPRSCSYNLHHSSSCTLTCSRCGGSSNSTHLPDVRVDEADDASAASNQHSHTSSVEWAFEDSLRTQDSTPGSFKIQVNYLLDKKDKLQFKQYLFDYSNNRDIETFVQRTTQLLDTPAKMTLWSFVLPLLPFNHKEYVLQQVQLPDSVINSSSSPTASGELMASSAESSDQSADALSAFKNQLEFLLTSQERKLVKRSLRHYKEDKNIQNLVEALSAILDTQSKRSLWIHILALLPASHQNYAKRKLSLPSGFLRQDQGERAPALPAKESRASSHRNRILSRSDDEFFVVGRHLDDAGDDQDGGHYDAGNVEMLKYSPKGSYAQRGQGRERNTPRAEHFMENPLYGKYDPLSLSRETDYPPNGAIADPGIYAYDAITLPHDKTNSYRRGRSNTAFVTHIDALADGQHSITNGHHGRSALPVEQHSYNSHQCTSSHVNGDLEDAGGLVDNCQLHTSQGSDNSYKRKVKQALQAVDDVVADLSGGETQRSDLELSDSAATVSPPLIPAPPPPPPPPPPAPPLPNLSAPLLVKRLNWETHSPEQIDQTVWGQLKSDDQLDIDVMVEYLELPQQFSTVKKKPLSGSLEKKMRQKKKILQEKKAFNISIILASLNLPDVTSSEERDKYIEQALLRVDVHLEDDGGVITPHLLRQLLQYAPDKEEVAQYLSYDGELNELSEVDRFCHRMIRIPGYQDRLQSMLFKATFDEKCAELEQSLQVVKEASEQIRKSQSFAKILELVLAMGNQLHKATNAPLATAFKVSSLNQLDSTKTMDKKKSFLDVLVQAVHEKFPRLFSTSQELSKVPDAEKVTFHDLSRETTELQQVLQQISSTMSHLSAEAKHYTVEDRFQEVMEHFLCSAEDRIQHLVRLQADTTEQYESMLTYLGEKSNRPDSKTIFSTISHFLVKFDNCRQVFAQKLAADALSPRSATSDAAQFISAL